MNLIFVQKINGKKTNFISKIWAGFNQGVPHYLIPFKERKDYMKKLLEKGLINRDEMPFIPKIHTIRQDPKNRWKAGNKIHFQVNPYRPSMFQFAPVLEVFSTQKIKILPRFETVWVDGGFILDEQIAELAINDGFDSIDDFWEYFNDEFEGKIIHWTNYKY